MVTPYYATSQSAQQSTQQAASQQASTSYIPNYSETPILEQIAQYAGQMAPQVYQWGMQQYANNQGNIDALMRRAQSYASPQQIASDMGMAEAGVQQSAEAARQNAIQDLQSYGIDPSSGRYAALDQASRVQAGAAAAGAGNQQRIADVATGNAMQNQAISASLQNVASGYGAANAANQFAGTGMNLKYSPLGTVSSGGSMSSGQSTGESTSQTPVFAPAVPNTPSPALTQLTGTGMPGGMAAGGSVDDATTGGFVSNQLSPSNGNRTDDVPAQLNAGEFVIPKDVAAWKGQEFFYKLMAQARKMRATSGNGNGGQGKDMPTGYQTGGNVGGPNSWGSQGITGVPIDLASLGFISGSNLPGPGSYALPAGTANPWTAPAAAPGDWDWRSNMGSTTSAPTTPATPSTPRADPTGGFRNMNQFTAPRASPGMNAGVGTRPPANTGYFGGMDLGSPNQFKFGNLDPRYGAA